MFVLLEQFAEVPDNCVFTVEYPYIRRRRLFIASLTDTGKEVIPLDDSIHKPSVLIKALQAISR